MAENNKNEGFNFPPVGGKNNKGSKFSGYWMYIIIAAIIIGFNFLSMPTSPERTTWQEVKTQMLEKGDVKELSEEKAKDGRAWRVGRQRVMGRKAEERGCKNASKEGE